ncbi:hypothetical protein IJT17_08380 [bacterium]|nr:hypothetical protein [bacterium]
MTSRHAVQKQRKLSFVNKRREWALREQNIAVLHKGKGVEQISIVVQSIAYLQAFFYISAHNIIAIAIREPKFRADRAILLADNKKDTDLKFFAVQTTQKTIAHTRYKWFFINTAVDTILLKSVHYRFSRSVHNATHFLILIKNNIT